jgi:lipoate-protein ligase A
VRLIVDDGANAAGGLARDEALMLHYGRGMEAPAQATLRLYTYRPHCALVGRFQTLDAEVDLDACQRLGVDVGRRPTGGGAIIMGPEQLGIAVTTRAPAGVGPRELLRRYADGVVAGLARLGVAAEFRGKNDLQVGARKIAGLGLYVDDRGALLFHASVLAGLDVELMLQVLRIPGAKLADKGVQRVHERITTVSLETGRPLAGADLREAIASGFGASVESALDAAELARAGELERRYTSEKWLSMRSVPRNARGTAAVKTPAGLLRVYAALQGGAISSVLIAGDFSSLPVELPELEAALRWCRADPARIAAVTRRALDGGSLEAAADEIAGAIWTAAERAMARPAAAPLRQEGSCYFPERETVLV